MEALLVVFSEGFDSRSQREAAVEDISVVVVVEAAVADTPGAAVGSGRHLWETCA